MMRWVLFILLLSAAVIAAENESEGKSTCEQEARKYFPDPNFNPQPGGAGAYGSPGGRTDFSTSVPSASDYERARKKREQYIKDCLAGKQKSE